MPDLKVISRPVLLCHITMVMLKPVIVALCCLFAGPALSQMPDNLARAEISPGWREGYSHVAGLTIRLAPGWKTYWRAPGDAGIPPSFNWSGSKNVADVRVQFPVPEVFSQRIILPQVGDRVVNSVLCKR